MAETAQKRDDFFFYFAWFILAFVVCSFLGKALFDTKDLPPLTLVHHFHALAMGSWFVLFAVQPTLVRMSKVDLHRLLGKLSPLFVLVFIFFAVKISILNWHRMSDPLIPTANYINLILFIGLYGAAIYHRAKPATHKRLMTYASLILLVLQVVPLIHDIIVEKRVHPATIAGLVAVLAATPIILVLSGFPPWINFLGVMMG